MDDNYTALFWTIGVVVFLLYLCYRAIWYETYIPRFKFRKPKKEPIRLADLLGAVEKVATDYGLNHFSASASMSPSFDYKLKGYVCGLDIIEAYTIQEVVDGLIEVAVRKKLSKVHYTESKALPPSTSSTDTARIIAERVRARKEKEAKDLMTPVIIKKPEAQVEIIIAEY